MIILIIAFIYIILNRHAKIHIISQETANLTERILKKYILTINIRIFDQKLFQIQIKRSPKHKNTVKPMYKTTLFCAKTKAYTYLRDLYNQIFSEYSAHLCFCVRSRIISIYDTAAAI